MGILTFLTTFAEIFQLLCNKGKELNIWFSYYETAFDEELK